MNTTSPHPTVKVAQHLTAIVDMHERLLEQAINDANDSEMPGGNAMASLGPVARLEAYRWQIDAIEDAIGRDAVPPHRRAAYEADSLTAAEDDTWEPPIQTLAFWSEQWRVEHDMELGERRATIATEASFLRWAVQWAWDNEPHWDEFARDVAIARRRIEDTLREGDRADTTRVVCDKCEEHPARLIKVYGSTAVEDAWKCPRCKHRFDRSGYRNAHAKMLRSEGTERYVPQVEALATLKSQGRPLRTVRKWLAPPVWRDRCGECGKAYRHQEQNICTRKVKDPESKQWVECGGFIERAELANPEAVVPGYCELVTHRTWLWWPELWDLHNTTRQVGASKVA